MLKTKIVGHMTTTTHNTHRDAGARHPDSIPPIPRAHDPVQVARSPSELHMVFGALGIFIFFGGRKPRPVLSGDGQST
jgi:hypothetical protein